MQLKQKKNKGGQIMKCKKILGIMILCVCFMGMYTVQAADETKVYIEVPDSAKPGDTITAKVMVDTINTAAVGLKLDVQYDADTLEYVSDQAGEKAKGTMNLSKHVPEEERVRVGIVALLGLKENGCYYEVQFKVKDVAKTTTEVGVKVAELTDSSGTELAYTTSSANLQVEGLAPEVEQNKKPQENVEDTKTNEPAPEQKEEGEQPQVANEPTSQVQQQTIQIPLQGESSKNIKDYFSNGQPEGMIWRVQDTQVAELKEDGTIVPKQAGNTNIVITDEQGNVVAEYPLEITEEQVVEKPKTNMGLLIAIVIIGAIIGTIIGFVMTKQKMKK